MKDGAFCVSKNRRGLNPRRLCIALLLLIKLGLFLLPGDLGMLSQHPRLKALGIALGKAVLIQTYKVIVNAQVKVALGLNTLLHLLPIHLVVGLVIGEQADAIANHHLAVPLLHAVLHAHHLKLLACQHIAEEYGTVYADQHQHIAQRFPIELGFLIAEEYCADKADDQYHHPGPEALYLVEGGGSPAAIALYIHYVLIFKH